MNISMRSQLTTSVALLGATAIAVTPITQPSLMSSAEIAANRVDVALTGVANPINAIAEVVEDANTNIFYNDGWGAPWNAIPDLEYAYSGYVGIVPDFGYWPLPVATTVLTNVSGYAWAGIRGVGDFANKSFQAVWNTPLAVVAAVQSLIAGDPDQALAILQNEIVLPLQKAVNSALNSVAYIVQNVIENVGIVASALPTILTNLAGVGVGGATFIATQAVNTLKTAFGQLTGGQFVEAWNTTVNGFLGRQGTLGYLEQLTIGPGVLTGDPSTPVIPSVRAVLTQGTRELANSFYNFPYNPATGPFQPATAAKPAASVAASTFSAPAEVTTGDDSSAGSDVSNDVAKPEVNASDASSTGADNSATPGDNSKAGSSSNSSNGSPKTGAKHAGTGGTKRAAKAGAGKSSE